MLQMRSVGERSEGQQSRPRHDDLGQRDRFRRGEAQLDGISRRGGTLVDTAASYGYGETESLLGQLLADVVPRSDVTIRTKAASAEPGGPFRRLLSRRAASPTGRSAGQVGTGLRRPLVRHYIGRQACRSGDWPPSNMPYRRAKVAMRGGRTKRLEDHGGRWPGRRGAGRAPVVANKVRYSLIDRGVEREVVPAGLELRLGIFRGRRSAAACSRQIPRRRPSDSRAARRGRPLPFDQGVTAAGMSRAGRHGRGRASAT